ncbi:DUF1329 domain-containing protein [Zavarzinia compransoris]|uniref:DUF1329 domain-containing protein n=1 Tax=Zavarzinia marina TaxID=2911065 RepID=UPI001F2D10C4|nr:DUF1329 domain-containing protein [Zavarzinia marina]MCF4165705.1 DUF1329 domain-containing protein [Zavarzinia marina]
MKRFAYLGLAIGLVALAGSGAAMAKGGPDQIARLGADLTPMGSIKAGNAEGTIPAWDGGIQSPPPGFVPGQRLVDPFASDPVLFTITGQNADQYAEKLSPGQMALLKLYPTYKMNVYQSRRSCSYTQKVYDANRKNAEVAKLTADGNGLVEGLVGVPFPLATEGVEFFWNHRFRPRLGFKFKRAFALAAVTRGGDYNLVKSQDEGILHYMGPGLREPGDVTSLSQLDNVWITYLSMTTSPARIAGSIILVRDNISDEVGPRQAWQYNPGTRRVVRAPDLAFDNPGTNADGLTTIDQFDMMNGSPERYSWKLVGKQEAYIGYNAYRANNTTYKEFLTANHPNQDVMRYELQRVNVIEASVREGSRHQYSKRVIFQDADSWTFTNISLYDSRGELWRVQDGPIINYYDAKSCNQIFEVDYDLQSGRYLAQTMNMEETPIDFNATELQPERYNPDALRRLGTR